ncbi:TPA: hydroxymethylbilane synthase [Candidatus Micrarchaeota archaeon]|nr:hydroxymethylbilane synthase [Candidatus Micrarchaeota archaeon]
MRIRVATRRSKLSIKQVNLVLSALKSRHPELEAELVFVKTKGDIHADIPPTKIGSKGIFEKEVNLAVLRGEADVAVHSLKDVPSEVSEGLVLAAVLPRESPLEALVSRERLKLEELPEGAVVGTSSIRRRAALRCLRPGLEVRHLRGNVDTRIRKLQMGMYDAILVAEAGLKRLGFDNLIAQVFAPTEITPAPCQGVIGVYAREGDGEVLGLLREVSDERTYAEAAIEREVTRRVGGGCFTPLGVCARVEGSKVTVIASLYSPTGRRKVTVVEEGDVSRRDAVVDKVSERLLREGEDVLSEARVVVE